MAWFDAIFSTVVILAALVVIAVTTATPQLNRVRRPYDWAEDPAERQLTHVRVFSGKGK